jgi:hypothetical protein
MVTVFNTEVTDSSTIYTTSTASGVTSDDYMSSSRSTSVSNDIITMINSEQTGKHISIGLNIKNSFFLCIYLDASSQYPSTLSSSSDHTSLQDENNTPSSQLTFSTTVYAAQNNPSTDTTSITPDKSYSSIQSTLISPNQTSTIKTTQIENNFSRLESSTEILNLTSISP